MNPNTSTEVLEEVDILEKEADLNSLVVHNDDVNTFEHVIETLIKVCKHDAVQAEQCTVLIHYKGKATVREDEFTKLKPMCESILDKGIQATIE